jgi:hypothetical protein
LSSENQGGSEVVSYQLTGIVLVLGCWIFLFNFKGPPSWTLQKMQLLKPKLLVMFKRIDEALKMVCSAYHFVKTW